MSVISIIKRTISVAFVLLCVFCATPAFAAHPLITDDTSTLGKGNFQLEANGDYGYFTDTTKAKTTTTNLAMTFTVGFYDNIDMALTIPYQSIANPSTTVSGMSDMAFEAKLRFYERGTFSSLFKPGISFGSGKESVLGNAGNSIWLLWVNSIVADPFEVHINLSYKTTPAENIIHMSGACLYKLFEGFRMVVNVGQDKGAVFTPAVIAVAGAIYTPTKNIDLDVGVKGGLTKEADNDFSIMAGTTYRW